MTTDTPSAEALADKLNIICHATGITACLNAADMLRSLASERDALRAALDAEREACAKLCDERAAYYDAGDDDRPDSRRAFACRACATVIRASKGAG